MKTQQYTSRIVSISSLRGVMSIIAVFFLASLANVTIKADDIFVDQGGTGDFTTIQDALNAAFIGDVILVSAGVYNESIVVPQGLNCIEIVGVSNENTIIDCSLGPVTVSANLEDGLAKVDFSDLKFTNGVFGAFFGFNSMTRFDNCVFEDNFSPFDGGAIQQLEGVLNVSSSSFENNTSLGNGGAVSVDESIFNVTNSNFVNNVSARRSSC